MNKLTGSGPEFYVVVLPVALLVVATIVWMSLRSGSTESGSARQVGEESSRIYIGVDGDTTGDTTAIIYHGAPSLRHGHMVLTDEGARALGLDPALRIWSRVDDGADSPAGPPAAGDGPRSGQR